MSVFVLLTSISEHPTTSIKGISISFAVISPTSSLQALHFNEIMWPPKSPNRPRDRERRVHCVPLVMAALETVSLLLPSQIQGSSSFLNTGTIVALCVFFALLCACIIIGHLLHGNRWANESITALLLVLRRKIRSLHSSASKFFAGSIELRASYAVIVIAGAVFRSRCVAGE